MRYQIWSFSPEFWGDQGRLIESFDTIQDARSVLKALEEVNINFVAYKIYDKKAALICEPTGKPWSKMKRIGPALS